MNKKTKLVLELLKTKASSLGFNKEELEGAAAKIADNLEVDDDATDEVLNAAVEKAVSANLFFLELSQKNANRIIQKNKEEREKAEAEARKKAEEEAAAKAAAEEEAKRKAAEEEAARKAEEERKAAEEAARKAAEEAGFQKLLDSDWAKGLTSENEKLMKQTKELTAALKAQQEENRKRQEEFEAFRNEFATMKAEKVKDTREKRLSTLLDGSGVFGDRIKKNYARMSFDTDEDFEEFMNGVQEDLKAFNQERADAGLANLGNVHETHAGGGDDHRDKPEVMSDAEIAALAATM